MPFSPTLVSNNILKRAFKEDVDVTPMKLQKLLYFTASEYAKSSGKTLLSEPFQTWRYGPVVRTVYDEFRSFGARPIRAFAKDAEGKAHSLNEKKQPEIRHAIEKVWQQGKKYNAVELSRITHLPDSAWTKAWEANVGQLDPEDIKRDNTYVDRLNLA